MNKKTVLVETNRKQKLSNKIPNTANLRPTSSHAVQCVEKAIQHDSSPIKSQSKEKKLATPKTKFTARDRSTEFCSFLSSRLKSFPAEEIKRIQHSPRPNIISSPNLKHTDHTEQHLQNHENIHHQGDGLHNHSPLQKLTNNIRVDNQNHLIHPESLQTSPEVIIPSSYLRSEGQAHRPFVPIARSYRKEPQVTTSLIINSGPSVFTDGNLKAENKASTPQQLNCVQTQKHEEKSENILKEIECEKQPVGGRNALLHRLKYMAKNNQHDPCQRRKNSSLQQYYIPVENPDLNASEKNAFSQQKQPKNTNPCSVQKPIDKIVTKSINCPQNQMNCSWNHENAGDYYQKNFNLQEKYLNSNNYPLECSEESQNSVACNKNVKNNQKIYQNLDRNQDSGYPPRKSTTHERKLKEKAFKFTPAMIRDQELLVLKMRQQGVNEDIMKRQFDALLNEQKRQLTYLQQFDEPEKLIDDDKLPVKRRITKIEEDGKPEWMTHITPSRITYATIEKMNQQNLKQKNNKSVKFNDQEIQQSEMKNRPFYQFGNKNGLQNTYYNFNPNLYQPEEQKIMDNTINNGQHCNCHFCTVNNQNYLIQQQQEMSNINDEYYLMQHPVQPSQNIPMGFNNYFINHDVQQKYVNNLNNLNYSNFNNCLYQNYNNALCSQKNSKNIGSNRKQNNGLQDEESIKAAMEELKNLQNCQGYEYLANLNKINKRLILNGVQDPEDEMMKNISFRQQPVKNVEEVRKEPRANGLENKRNPNNPPPPLNLHMKNFNEPFKEYPRRKDELSAENYLVYPQNMMTDENILSLDRKEHQKISPAFKNIPDYSKNNPLMAQVYQVQGQVTGPYDYHNGYQLVRSNSMPCDVYSHRYQYHTNDLIVQDGRPLDNNGKKNQVNDYSQPKNSECLNSKCEINNQNNVQNCKEVYRLVEPRIIGGVKYFPRKLNYASNLNNCSHLM